MADERIREYWDQRAREAAGKPTATTDDVHLRELEHRTLVRMIEGLGVEAPEVLDIGCGDGLTTLRVARDLPRARLHGVDFAESMVAAAARRLESEADGAVRARLTFRQADVTELEAALDGRRFDVVTSGRCLINLPTPELQRRAVEQIATAVRPGGTYIAIENFVEGQAAMNQARAAVGLPEIPVRWHNRFMSEAELRAWAEPGFESVEFVDFSSAYYFATRVVYSGMCAMRGEKPDYDHEIHRLAPRLPWFGTFSPIRLVLLRRRREGGA